MKNLILEGCSCVGALILYLLICAGLILTVLFFSPIAYIIERSEKRRLSNQNA